MKRQNILIYFFDIITIYYIFATGFDGRGEERMKKKILKWCLVPAAILWGLSGCIEEAGFHDGDECQHGDICQCDEESPGEDNASGKATVTFGVARNGSKSAISPEEGTINNLAIAVYRDGNLENHGYVEGEENLTLELTEGQEYNIYATANTGELCLPPEESDFLEVCTLESYDIADLADALPMCWSSKKVKVKGGSLSIAMEMERLVSKLHFSVNKDLLAGLEVTAARLCQGAVALYPFRWETGNKATEDDGTVDGDYASAADLTALNNGEEIVFYALENCQGDLLPDNTDPWKKVPDNLDYRSDYCSYLEVECSFKEGFLYQGNVTYRFYAGMDNCRNFDIRRNTEQHISLTLSQDGLDRISWMVESDVTLSDGYAAGYLIEGNHPVNGMYAGERLRYGVLLSDELADLLGDGILDCRIFFQPDNSEGAIEFGNLEVENAEYNMYSASGTAVQPGTGKLLLTRKNGSKIATLDKDVSILAPSMAFSLNETVSDDENDFMLTSAPQCRINGGDLTFHLYLTDKNGYNLNKSAGAGFDLEAFYFPQTHLNGIPEGIGTGNLSISCTSGTSDSGGPAATYKVHCENDGSDSELNDRLASLLSTARNITFDVLEDKIGMKGEGEFEFEIPEAVITLVDNGWAGWHDTQMSIIVDNPSRLPLDIVFWQFMSSGQLWGGGGYAQNETWLEENVTIDEFGYLGTVFTPTTSVNGMTDWDKVCTAGRAATIRAERNERGSAYIPVDGKEAYPVRGLTSEALRKSLVHYKLENNEMYNLFSVSPSTVPVRFIDILSDGSEVFNIMYGSDSNGFNDQGIFGSGISYFNNISARKLENLVEKHLNGDTSLSIRIDSSGKIYARVSKGSLSLSFNIKGSANGYVLTYPNGTWRNGQDNYCTANILTTTNTFTIGTSETLIDSQTVQNIFNKIYAQTFFDSHNKIGSSNNYQHSAHPTSLSLTIQAKLAGSSTGEGYVPVSVSASGSNASFYHAQEATTYTVSISSNFPTMRIARVTEKAL